MAKTTCFSRFSNLILMGVGNTERQQCHDSHTLILYKTFQHQIETHTHDRLRFLSYEYRYSSSLCVCHIKLCHFFKCFTSRWQFRFLFHYVASVRMHLGHHSIESLSRAISYRHRFQPANQPTNQRINAHHTVSILVK